MRIVAIGDIGVVDDMIHIGDEAMFEALVHEVRARGIEHITGVSSNPAESAQRYGIDAVRPFGFGRDAAADLQRMSAILAAASGTASLGSGDPASELIEAIAAADGVAIAGGGNMSSIWPQHIFERATLGAVAALTGTPLVVTGQTIGPVLDAAGTELVRDLLRSAALVGLREPASFALVQSLGIAQATATIDDASFLAWPEVERDESVLVSLASHVGDADRSAVASALAVLLDTIADATGLAVRFLPHFGSTLPHVVRGDSVMHELVRERMSTPSSIIIPTTSASAAAQARGAALVLTSRYHPAVFAVPAGVPVLAMPVDGYTGVKLRGALGNLGQDAVLPVEQLLTGLGPAAALQLWRGRAATASRTLDMIERRRSDAAGWWDRVADALAGRA